MLFTNNKKFNDSFLKEQHHYFTMGLRDTDYIQKITVYIKKNLSKGYTPEALKWALVKQGYTKSEVDKAMKLVNEQLAAEVPEMKEKQLVKKLQEQCLKMFFLEQEMKMQD